MALYQKTPFSYLEVAEPRSIVKHYLPYKPELTGCITLPLTSRNGSSRQQLLALVQELHQVEAAHQQHQAQKAALSQRSNEVIVQSRQEVEELKRQLESLQQWLTQFEGYRQFPTGAYRQVQLQADKTYLNTPQRLSDRLNRPFLWLKPLLNQVQKLWNRLQGNSRKQLLKAFVERAEPAIVQTLSTPFPLQVPLTWDQFSQLRRHILEQLELAQTWEARSQRYSTDLERLLRLQQQYEEPEQPEVDAEETDFYARFYQQYHVQQQEIFRLSWSYLQQESLRRKAEIASALQLYAGVLSRDSDAQRRMEAQGMQFYQNLSLAFPVITSTLQSVRNMFPLVQTGILRRAILDEAGMTLLHQAAPVLMRSQQATIIGDPLQLEPVMPLVKDDQEKFYRQAFLERGLTSEDVDRFSPTSIQTATAYHRAAGASGAIGDLGHGIQLKEHFRSVRSIAAFSNRICNYELDIRTPDRDSPLGTNLIAYHVEGRIERQVNLDEAAAIEQIIKVLLAQGYSLQDEEGRSTIGVISPFRQQAIGLQRQLRSVLSSQDVNTVHKFQGGQREIILFSPRQCCSTDSFWFINRVPNLLNVTVSRSCTLFILVGNLKVLKEAGGYLAQLVDHIHEYGEIRELPSLAEPP